MAKINTTNYQPVTAWNGTQDLLVVEQPDGTKVATPEQVKQYVDAFMDDEPTEGSEEAVKSGGVFNAIENSVSLKTATGNPITLTDAANANAEELSMTIEPIQSGSGDPSPENVRPISGLTSGEVQTTNGTDTNTATITFGQTVYGGSVNFKTGEVTVTHAFESGTINYLVSQTHEAKYQQGGEGRNKNLCDKLPYEYHLNSNPHFYFANNRLVTRGMDDSTEIELCYELATPTTLTLTPAELELLKGNNTITANGAEISLSYYSDNAIGVLAGRVDTAREQIATINTRINKNKLTSVVEITSYTASGNRYTCPSDGYVKLIVSGGGSGWVYINGQILLSSAGSSSGHAVAISVYVRKGMNVYITGGSSASLYFIPIV